MHKLNVSYLNRLRNQEFPDVFRAICSVLERDEISETYLVDFLEKAKSKMNSLGLLKNMRMKHPITRTITQLTRDRHAYLLSLKGKITYGLKSPIIEERNAANVLDAWLDRYREYLKQPRTSEQNNLVAQMADDIDKFANINDAFNSAGLLNMFDSIKAITTDIELAYDNRSESMEDQRIMANKVRLEAYDAMKRLINALDMAIEEGNENSEKYKRYWNEISKILDMFYAKVQMRSTWHKYAAEKKNEQPVDNGVDGETGDDAEGNAPATRTTPRMTTAMRSTPYSTAGLNKGMDMDLQNGQPLNDSLTIDNDADDAMNGSVTFNNNDVATPTDGNKAQADDATTQNGTNGEATTGNGELTSSDPKPATVDDDTTGHSDANDQVANIE